MANATGSLSILDTPTTSPASFIRTITDRRRCRSIPTYCCSRSTRVSFFRFRDGVETPSVPRTLGSRRGEEPWGITTDLATKKTFRTARRPSSHHPAGSRRSGAALLHDMNTARLDGRGSVRRSVRTRTAIGGHSSKASLCRHLSFGLSRFLDRSLWPRQMLVRVGLH